MNKLTVEKLVRLVKNTNQTPHDWAQMANVLDMIDQLCEGAQMFVYKIDGVDDDGKLLLVQVEYPDLSTDDAYDWVLMEHDEDTFTVDEIDHNLGHVEARLLIQYLELLDIDMDAIDDSVFAFNGDTTENRVEFLNDLTSVLYRAEASDEVPVLHSDNPYTKMWQSMVENTAIELHLI